MLAIFLDIETTGLDSTRHNCIDIAFKIIDMTSGELKDKFQSVVKHSKDVWDKHDPESIAINGYTWEEVKKGREMDEISKEIISKFKRAGIVRGEAVFICQNPAFDRGFFNHVVSVYHQERLNWPYHWLDLASMYWATVVTANKPIPNPVAFSKNAIAARFGLPPEEDPHKAINGVNHLIQCYSAVLNLNWQGLGK